MPQVPRPPAETSVQSAASPVCVGGWFAMKPRGGPFTYHCPQHHIEPSARIPQKWSLLLPSVPAPGAILVQRSVPTGAGARPPPKDQSDPSFAIERTNAFPTATCDQRAGRVGEAPPARAPALDAAPAGERVVGRDPAALVPVLAAGSRRRRPPTVRSAATTWGSWP